MKNIYKNKIGTGYKGFIIIPFEIEYASTHEVANSIVNRVLDEFGEHDFSHMSFSWDNPDWTINQVEENY